MISIVVGASAPEGSQQRFARDIANAGTERDPQGGPVPEARERLDAGKTDHHDVIGLKISQRQREEILALHLDESGAAACGLLFTGDFAGAFLFLDPGADHAAIDVHFAAMHGGAGGQGERVDAIHCLCGSLVKDLVQLDAQEIAADMKLAFDAFERELHAGLLEPADQTEGGGR